MKSDVVVEYRGSTNSIFLTYYPNTEMMNFMAVKPLAIDNNPLENVINRSDVQVTSLQMNFSKVKNIDKISISKETNKMVYFTLLKRRGKIKFLQRK